MKSFTTLIVVSLAGLSMASSATNGTSSNESQLPRVDLTSDQRTCRKMYSIDRAQRLVANTTRMDQITKSDASRAQRIRDLAAKDAPELARLQQNKTLVAYCDVYRAHEQTVRQCYHIRNLDKLQRRMRDRIALEDAARQTRETEIEVRRRWQHDIDVATQQKTNKTMMVECEKIRNSKSAGGKDESGKQKSAASAVGSSLFAVVLAGLVAGLAI